MFKLLPLNPEHICWKEQGTEIEIQTHLNKHMLVEQNYRTFVASTFKKNV